MGRMNRWCEMDTRGSGSRRRVTLGKKQANCVVACNSSVCELCCWQHEDDPRGRMCPARTSLPMNIFGSRFVLHADPLHVCYDVLILETSVLVFQPDALCFVTNSGAIHSLSLNMPCIWSLECKLFHCLWPTKRSATQEMKEKFSCGFHNQYPRVEESGHKFRAGFCGKWRHLCFNPCTFTLNRNNTRQPTNKQVETFSFLALWC